MLIDFENIGYVKCDNILLPTESSYIPASTWGFIKGDITEQKDLVNLINNLEIGLTPEQIELLSNTSNIINEFKTDYYTKREVDNIVSNIEVGDVDLTGYATEDWVRNQGYLTEHQSLADYYNKSEIDDIVNNIDVDLTGYATEQWVEDKGYLTEHQSLVDYAKKQWVLDNYYLKGDVDELLNDTKDDTKDWVTEQGYLSESTLLTDYYTKEEIDDAFDNIEIGITPEQIEIINNLDDKFASVELSISELTSELGDKATIQYVDEQDNNIIGSINSVSNDISNLDNRLTELENNGGDNGNDIVYFDFEIEDGEFSKNDDFNFKTVAQALKENKIVYVGGGLVTSYFIGDDLMGYISIVNNNFILIYDAQFKNFLQTTVEVTSQLYTIPNQDDLDGIYDELYHLNERVTDLENNDVDLTGYATEQWVEDKGYLTEHQSLDNYYTIEQTEELVFGEIDVLYEEIQNLAGAIVIDCDSFENIEWKTVTDICQIPSQRYVIRVGGSDGNGAGSSGDMYNIIQTYASDATGFLKEYILILSNLASNQTVKITARAQNVTVEYIDIATENWVTEQGYLTEHQSLDNYYNKSEVDNIVSNNKVDLTGYATEQWVEDKGYLTEHQSLNDYYTKSETDNLLSNKLDTNLIWTGTQSEWDNLSTEQQASYIIAMIEI